MFPGKEESSCFSSTVLSTTEEIAMLRSTVDSGEIEAAYKAYSAGRSEKDLEKAYWLFRVALGGTGTSEFSKKFNAIVEDGISKFCSNNELFIKDFFYKIKNKFRNQKINYDVIENKSIISCFGDLRHTLSKLAILQQSSGDIKKAVVLQKQAVFWEFLDTRNSIIAEEYLEREVEKLMELLGY
jgi:hypothetical protein